jgi:hypothetical protein
MHFERTIEKMQSLKTMMHDLYLTRRDQVVNAVGELTLVQRCQTYMREKNLSYERLENLTKQYYKAILTDVNDILEKYMGMIKNLPAYFNSVQFREKIDFLRNQLDRENFQIYLGVTIDYLKQINGQLVTFTNKMIEYASESKTTLSTMCMGTLYPQPREVTTKNN